MDVCAEARLLLLQAVAVSSAARSWHSFAHASPHVCCFCCLLLYSCSCNSSTNMIIWRIMILFRGLRPRCRPCRNVIRSCYRVLDGKPQTASGLLALFKRQPSKRSDFLKTRDLWIEQHRTDRAAPPGAMWRAACSMWPAMCSV